MTDLPGFQAAQVRAADNAVSTRALWTIGAGRCELRHEPLQPVASGEALVRTLYSGISRGTESLVFAGRVPPSEFTRMRAPFQAGDFPFPVKYGYAAVGHVETGPTEWVGRRVLVLHPHQDRFVVPVAALYAVPADVPTRRAVLGPNMETALNGIWDSAIGPGDRVAIVGAGVIGSLVAAIAGRIPGCRVVMFDTDPTRAVRAGDLDVGFVLAGALDGDLIGRFDCVFHTSATATGLQTALELAGDEARIVELSWYGDKPVSLALGAAFHSKRLQIVASQVGKVSPSRRARFDFRRRMEAALALLADDRLDALLGRDMAFAEAPATMADLLADASGTCTVFHYGT